MLATTNSRMDYYGGEGVVNFVYDFLILEASHLLVYVDGVPQVIGADYTIKGANILDPIQDGIGEPAGGTVIFSVAPAYLIPIVIVRMVPITQLVDYVAHDAFPAETHEGALDKLTMIAQQIDALSEKILRIPITSPPTTVEIAPEANNFLAWSSDGSALVNVPWMTTGGPLVAHANTHKNGGADEIDIGGLSGLLADDQHVLNGEVDSEVLAYLLARTGAGVNKRLFIDAAGTAIEWAKGMKVGTFTRAMDADSNVAVAYTGVGFKPSMIIFFGGIHNSVIGNYFGVCDGSVNYSVGNLSGVTAHCSGMTAVACISLDEASGKAQAATLVSFDADGFTLNWVRTGSTAAGTATMFYVAFR